MGRYLNQRSPARPRHLSLSRKRALLCCAVAMLSAAMLSPAFAKEAFYLRTGFRLEADSHTQESDKFILKMGPGTIELPASEVLRFETIPEESNSATATMTCQQPAESIEQAAYEEGLPPELVRSVAEIESRLRQDAVSPKGAIGLMQLMPATARELGVEPTLAHENALGGARYLRELLIRYRGNSALALAAYNAGPGAVARYRGVPPYAETRRYVEHVLQLLREPKQNKTASVSAHVCTASASADRPTP